MHTLRHCGAENSLLHKSYLASGGLTVDGKCMYMCRFDYANRICLFVVVVACINCICLSTTEHWQSSGVSGSILINHCLFPNAQIFVLVEATGVLSNVMADTIQTTLWNMVFMSHWKL